MTTSLSAARDVRFCALAFKKKETEKRKGPKTRENAELLNYSPNKRGHGEQKNSKKSVVFRKCN